MRSVFRWTAAVLTGATLLLWWAQGPNWGWTKTSAARTIPDPVTGLNQIVWDRVFQPGLDFLGLALGVAGVLTALSFAGRKKALRPPPAQDSNAP